MIITRTPFRISFFGGGTDYPECFEKYGGTVLGTAIDKSAYISVTQFYSKLFDYSIRVAYRQVECVRTLNEIQHSPFRECLRWCGIMSDVEVNYTGELPSFSGLGSSSSFVVGLLNALYAFQGRSVHPIQLAYQAIELEREVLKDPVGCQDQTFAAVGGFNLIEFRTTRDIVVHRVPLSAARVQEFEAHLLVLDTGTRRRAGEIAAAQIRNVETNREHLKRMRAMADEGHEILTGNCDLGKFGLLLHEAWTLKARLGDSVSNGMIRHICDEGRTAGALGAKLLGAGGGGFVLFFVPPEKRKDVRQRLRHLEEIPIRINAPGSHIIHA